MSDATNIKLFEQKYQIDKQVPGIVIFTFETTGVIVLHHWVSVRKIMCLEGERGVVIRLKEIINYVLWDNE